MCLRSHSKTPFASPHCKTLHMPSPVASQHPSAPILESLGIPCFSHDWEPVIAATAASGPEAGPDGIRPGRGAQVESPPAHTSHPPPTIAEPLRELCTTTRMTYISPFALFPCWLVCHIHTSVKTNPTRTGRQIVADESLFGTEGEASSISSLALMRRPVDGSGNEALHSLPSTQREIVITAIHDIGHPFSQYGGLPLGLANGLGDITATNRLVRGTHDSCHPVIANQRAEATGRAGAVVKLASFEPLHLPYHFTLYTSCHPYRSMGPGADSHRRVV